MTKQSFDERPIPAMEYVKVESSQIDSVGFGEGLYGPETLGIRFENKSGISEYHYGGVSHDTYVEFINAKSMGVFFKDHIKKRPDLYPFTKVEADPQQPAAKASAGASGKSGNDTTRTKESQQPSPDMDGDAVTDTPSPGAALALIDGMDDNLLFTPGKITDDQLATMRSDWLAEAKKYDISTEAKRTALKRFARPLQKLRTGIEARAKELTGATKRKIAAIDTEKRRLVLVVGGIEDEVLSPLTQWEQEEETRKAQLTGRVKFIVDMGQTTLYNGIPDLEAAIASVESFDVSTMQEFKVSAESAIAASLRVLKQELERRKAAELLREELDSLRAADAKRQEEARIAAAAQKLADEQVQARLSAAVEAAKAETRQEVIAELSTPVEQAPQAFVYPEIPTPVAQQAQGGISENHEQAYNREAVEALMGCALTRHEAMAVLTAIVEGRIPHITITY